MNRRQFLTRSSLGLGALTLGNLLHADSRPDPSLGLNGIPHFNSKVNRIVYLFMSGGPSQLDLFDYKPNLSKFHGQELPDSVRKGQRLTGMSGSQSSIPITASEFSFRQYGNSGAWISELFPHISKLADDLCFIKNHAYGGY